MNDQLVRLMSRDGYIRASAANTTDLMNQICHLQHTDPTATVALGRVASGACLMGSLLKGEQRLALSIEANGPLQKLQAEADAQGNVRATIKNPRCNLLPLDGRYDVANAIGKAGFLHVIKDLGLKEPYNGTVQLVSSEVAEDIAHYFVASEQIPTSLALGVILDRQGGVAASGGLLIQAMPECPDDILERLEGSLKSLPPVSKLLCKGQSPQEILEQVLQGIPYELQTRYDVMFRCNCTKNNVLKMLSQFPVEELRTMVKEQKEITVTCEYCKKEYCLTASELKDLLI